MQQQQATQSPATLLKTVVKTLKESKKTEKKRATQMRSVLRSLKKLTAKWENLIVEGAQTKQAPVVHSKVDKPKVEPKAQASSTKRKPGRPKKNRDSVNAATNEQVWQDPASQIIDQVHTSDDLDIAQSPLSSNKPRRGRKPGPKPKVGA